MCVCVCVCVCVCARAHMCLIRSTKLSAIHQQHSPPLFLLFPKAPCYTECIRSSFREAAVYQELGSISCESPRRVVLGFITHLEM